jgi:tRNA(adenine34) deaminase
MHSKESDDIGYMRAALVEAEKAFSLGEVPVGAVVVYQDRIIARAHNRVEELQDASMHAELLCLKEAAKVLENWRLHDAILYCTLEPCSMCAGAMLLSRLSCLVWGAPDLRHGAHGSWVNLLDGSHPIHRIEVRTGVLEEEASMLMKKFFRERR